MKKLLATSALLGLMVFSPGLAFAQSADQPATRDNATTTRYDEPRHNWSWLGLLGLIGLVGLSGRKTEHVRGLQSHPVR